MSSLDWLLLLIATAAVGLALFGWRRPRPGTDAPADHPDPGARERDELLNVANSLPVGILVTDERTRVRRYNQAAAAMLSLDSDPSHVLGRSLIEVVRDYELDAVLRTALLGSAGLAHPVLDFPYRLLYLRVSACALLDTGGVLGGLLVLTDATEMYRVERVRRDFVANVSHEFRTPLATAKLLVETAASAVDDDTAAARQFLVQADRELDGLTRLVSELLDLARIEAGQTLIEPKPLVLNAALADAVSRFSEPAAQAGLHLLLEASPSNLVVLADEARLSQVLGNLIQNAIKFTAAGGQITVAACTVGEAAEVRVTDTGIGIPPEDLERVFERFYKVDRARSALIGQAKAAGGTGLGLAIARHIVEGQGGRIWARSEAGAGTTFHFTMPLATGVTAA